MAFLVKNQKRTSANIQPILSQWINVTQPAIALPQSAQSSTGQIFTVKAGRVLCWLLLGEVTTVIQSQATTVKISSKKLNAAGTAAVGTAVDISATVDGNAKEVGSLYRVLSSGAAAIWSNAGAGLATLGSDAIVLPQGEVYVTTGADSTGAMKWDMWYQPLDPGAYVVASTLTNSLLTTAI